MKSSSVTGNLLETVSSCLEIHDRTGIGKKSARKDEKTLFWPPSIIACLVTKPRGNETVPK